MWTAEILIGKHTMINSNEMCIRDRSDTTGNIWGTAFRADITVCLAYEKIGAVLYPGTEYAGRRIVKDIGIKANKISGAESVYTYEKKDLPRLLPKRRPDSNKGNFGKVLMITGCSGMAGASYLSAKAAYCAGAGLVQIYTDETNRCLLYTSMLLQVRRLLKQKQKN